MKTKSKRRQLFKKKSLIRKHKGGNPELPNNEHDLLEFIKLLIKNNLQDRLEINPKSIQEYTIGNHNFDIINSFVDRISHIDDLCHHELHPVFSKGCERVIELVRFINNRILWEQTEDLSLIEYKSLLIAQFIIINQVFGDGNHRAALFVLNNYSNYSYETKNNIMSITRRIHDWNGDIKDRNFWIQVHNTSNIMGDKDSVKKQYELYLPDLTKLHEMIRLIHPRNVYNYRGFYYNNNN
jgi:hypothetical protein